MGGSIDAMLKVCEDIGRMLREVNESEEVYEIQESDLLPEEMS